jgi:serine/threonine-protein kinase HipA
MTSEPSAAEAYVWIWLPGRVEPIVAGLLSRAGETLVFNYGQSYLRRPDRIAIYEPELPLEPGTLSLLPGLRMPSAIRDASPDTWGRRVIINRKLGLRGKDADTVDLDELTYLLESGSNRIGALDFQISSKDYVPRAGQSASLDELMEAADKVQRGVPLGTDLDLALQHGTALGGARPKVLIDDDDRQYIAKFSASNDLYNVVKAEFVAMRLARLAGLDVATVGLTRALGKDVILIERFDRLKGGGGWHRKAMVSALTMLALDEMMAGYASYQDLAEIVRLRFVDPKTSLRELFARLTFNILCGNTDDHARNHAAFWDGKALSMTPAYDVCPQLRTGGEASQAMKIHDGENLSRLSICLDAASDYLLSTDQAKAIIIGQVRTIGQNWDRVCDEAELPEADRTLLWGRAFLNPFAFEGAPAGIGPGGRAR